MSESLRLNKIGVARRQLRTAIELWFSGGDEVSIHTLAYASHEVMHAVYRKRGFNDLLFDSQAFSEELRPEIMRHLKKDATFFKHAQRDVDDVREFNPRSSALFMVMSVYALQIMREPLDLAESAFISWFRINEPSLFQNDALSEGIADEDLAEIRNLGKRDFLETFKYMRRTFGR